jgi:hypothetical protein
LDAAEHGWEHDQPSPSNHPAAVKARRWRERKRQERAGCVFVTVAVSSSQLRALRQLGLVSGDPDRWRQPPPPTDELTRAVQHLLELAEPLVKVADALQLHVAIGTEGREGATLVA